MAFSDSKLVLGELIQNLIAITNSVNSRILLSVYKGKSELFHSNLPVSVAYLELI